MWSEFRAHATTSRGIQRIIKDTGCIPMTIQVELDAETETRLKALADREGITPEQYASKFLRYVLPLYAPGSGRLLPGDVERMTKVMTAGSKHLPILPPEATERENFYEDDRIKYS